MSTDMGAGANTHNSLREGLWALTVYRDGHAASPIRPAPNTLQGLILSPIGSVGLVDVLLTPEHRKQQGT